MKLLYTNSKSEFQRCTTIYKSELAPLIRVMEDEVLKSGPLGGNTVFKEYTIYVKWPIRKLEYSFVLLNTDVSKLQGKKILDVGCGVTPLPNYYSRKQAKVFAIDIDSDIIELLKRFGNQLYGSIVHYCTMDITKKFRFPDETFDIITCVSVLEHLEHGQDIFCLQEMLRVLKPHGKIVMTIDFVPETRWSGLWKLGKRVWRLLYPSRFYEKQKRLREKYREVIHSVRLPNRGYTPFILERTLGDILAQYGSKESRYLTNMPNLEQVKRFWQEHYFPGCLYDYSQGRSYAALGIVLSKSPTLCKELWPL